MTRSNHMSVGYVRSSMEHLPLQFFHLLEEWLLKQIYFTSVFPKSGIHLMLLYWDGCLSFSLLRSSIRCIRGSRSSKGCFGQSLSALPIDLVQSRPESNMLKNLPKMLPGISQKFSQCSYYACIMLLSCQQFLALPRKI